MSIDVLTTEVNLSRISIHKPMPSFYPADDDRERKPSYDYRPPPPSERLEYVLMDQENYPLMLELFEGDPDPFVMEAFKSRDALEEYKWAQLDWNRYSFKHGAADYFMRLRGTETYVGVLHLYDLNSETYADMPLRCTIGFAVHRDHRRRGYATEGIRALCAHVVAHYGRPIVLAYTELENTVSQQLMLGLGFRDVTTTEGWSKKYRFFSIDLRTERLRKICL